MGIPDIHWSYCFLSKARNQTWQLALYTLFAQLTVCWHEKTDSPRKGVKIIWVKMVKFCFQEKPPTPQNAKRIHPSQHFSRMKVVQHIFKYLQGERLNPINWTMKQKEAKPQYWSLPPKSTCAKNTCQRKHQKIHHKALGIRTQTNTQTQTRPHFSPLQSSKNSWAPG